MKGAVNIANETKGTYPRLPFQALKQKILGKRYSLSIVFIGDSRSRALNRLYRKQDKPTNILAFPLSKYEGELYVNLKQVKREIKIFNRDFKGLVTFLLIHGMFHLKGERHGSRMETKEMAVRALFGV